MVQNMNLSGDRAPTQSRGDRPTVGVAPWLSRARWEIMDATATVVETSVIAKLEDSGADVVILPPQARAPVIASRLDGIVLLGGPDMVASGDQTGSNAEDLELRRRRDESESALVHAALDLDLPLLGICRGLQVMNVAAGGTLVEHVPDRYQGVVHSYLDEPGPARFAVHEVEAEDFLGDMLGRRFEVMSGHHQAVDRIGREMTVVARSDDGLIEAIAVRDKRFAIGVQWHPEAHQESLIFDAFVRAAGEYRDALDAASPTR